jgi:hypothetical protein
MLVPLGKQEESLCKRPATRSIRGTALAPPHRKLSEIRECPSLSGGIAAFSQLQPLTSEAGMLSG